MSFEEVKEKQSELIKELEELGGMMRTPKNRRRGEEILIELKKLKRLGEELAK